MTKTSAKQTSAGEKKIDQNPKTVTVLVVDDNEQNLELLQAYLEDVQCQQSPQGMA